MDRAICTPEIAHSRGAICTPIYTAHSWTNPTHYRERHPDPVSRFSTVRRTGKLYTEHYSVYNFPVCLPRRSLYRTERSTRSDSYFAMLQGQQWTLVQKTVPPSVPVCQHLVTYYFRLTSWNSCIASTLFSCQATLLHACPGSYIFASAYIFFKIYF